MLSHGGQTFASDPSAVGQGGSPTFGGIAVQKTVLPFPANFRWLILPFHACCLVIQMAQTTCPKTQGLLPSGSEGVNLTRQEEVSSGRGEKLSRANGMNAQSNALRSGARSIAPRLNSRTPPEEALAVNLIVNFIDSRPFSMKFAIKFSTKTSDLGFVR